MGAGTGAVRAGARAPTYAATRTVWGGRSAPTRASPTRSRTRTIQVELARLMIAKAAALYDAGRDLEAGVAANMAKYAAAEAARSPWTRRSRCTAATA